MNLHELDLNLVPALRALLDERHVTRASLRLGVSQSAMSRALGRLREHFKDELLIKTQTGMVYTPLALALLPEVTSLCEALERTLIREPMSFDPAQAQLHISIGMSELGQVLWAPALLTYVHELAPGVTMSLSHPKPGDTITLSTCLDPDEAIFSAPYVALGAHNVIKLAQDLEALALLAHGEHTHEPAPQGHAVDLALRELGLRRHRALSSSSLLTLTMSVRSTPLVLMLPEPVASMMVKHAGDELASVRPPQEALAQDPQWSRWPQWHVKLSTQRSGDERLDQAALWLTQALKEIIHGDLSAGDSE